MKQRRTILLGGLPTKPSIPQAGQTIAGAMKAWAEPLASVFGTLIQAAINEGRQDTLAERHRATFSPLIARGSLEPEEELRLAVSALLCEWLLARLSEGSGTELSLEEAERWFLRDSHRVAPGIVLRNADWIPRGCLADLDNLSFDDEFLDLLPYVLEIFESVEADGQIPGRGVRRTRQRAEGVVYTPSDVSDFIVRETLAPWLKESNALELPTCLDPACGTGPFLRSAVSQMLASPQAANRSVWDIVQSLYGMDVSHHAIQLCAFALLAYCLRECHSAPIEPWRLWQTIRMNLTVVDSTLVAHGTSTFDQSSLLRMRANLRHDLLHSSPEILRSRYYEEADGSTIRLSRRIPWGETNGVVAVQPLRLSDVFPEAGDGFSVVFGNPPYSRLPQDGHQGVRAALFSSAPAGTTQKSASLYALFVEMLWRFGHPMKSSGGMVVPMSIAYSTETQIQRLRSAIELISGEWRFVFFDRTPDSLFGDDVKTRNCIVFWHGNRNSHGSQFWTGPFLRWNSRSRKDLFRHIRFVPLGNKPIRSMVPKLGSSVERDVYYRIGNNLTRLASVVGQVSTSALRLGTQDPRLVFYTVTAYNWLPTFREIPPSRDRFGIVSVAPSLRAVSCMTPEEAWFVFGCLNSRLAYWLWRVEGDGFHLNHDFIRRLPFHPSILPPSKGVDFRRLAEELWTEMQLHPVESVNGGRFTVSYYPYACSPMLDAIDALLAEALGLPARFVVFLRRFVIENIVVGRQGELGTNPALRRITPKEGAHE